MSPVIYASLRNVQLKASMLFYEEHSSYLNPYLSVSYSHFAFLPTSTFPSHSTTSTRPFSLLLTSSPSFLSLYLRFGKSTASQLHFKSISHRLATHSIVKPANTSLLHPTTHHFPFLYHFNTPLHQYTTTLYAASLSWLLSMTQPHPSVIPS